MGKISALPQDSSPTATDYIVTVDTETGQTKKVLLSDLATLIFANYPQTAWSSFVSGTSPWLAASSNPAIGNGTITATYIQIGKTVIGRIFITAGSTTTFGTGAWEFLLPVTAAANYASGTGITPIGSCWFDDTGSQNAPGYTYLVSTTRARLRPHVTVAGSNPVYLTNVTDAAQNVPSILGSGDHITVSFIYEAA